MPSGSVLVLAGLLSNPVRAAVHLCLSEIGFGENHFRPLLACTAAGLDLGSFLLTQLLFEDLLEVGLILTVHFFVLWVRFCAQEAPCSSCLA